MTLRTGNKHRNLGIPAKAVVEARYGRSAGRVVEKLGRKAGGLPGTSMLSYNLRENPGNQKFMSEA